MSRGIKLKKKKALFQWTPWTEYTLEVVNGNMREFVYRTNGQKVIMKCGDTKSHSSCHPNDFFNLDTGCAIAKVRLDVKLAMKNLCDYMTYICGKTIASKISISSSFVVNRK